VAVCWKLRVYSSTSRKTVKILNCGQPAGKIRLSDSGKRRIKRGAGMSWRVKFVTPRVVSTKVETHSAPTGEDVDRAPRVSPIDSHPEATVRRPCMGVGHPHSLESLSDRGMCHPPGVLSRGQFILSRSRAVPAARKPNSTRSLIE